MYSQIFGPTFTYGSLLFPPPSISGRFWGAKHQESPNIMQIQGNTRLANTKYKWLKESNLPNKQRHEHWCRSDCFVGRWKSQRPGLEPFCLKENCLDYFDVTFISSWFKSQHGSTHFQKQSLTILFRIFSYIWKAPWQKQYESTLEG